MILVCGGSFQAGLDESYWRFPRWRIWGVWVLFEYPISAHGWVFAIFGKTWSIHWAEYEFVGWFIQIPPYGQHLYLTPIRLPIMLVGGLALLPAVIVMIGRRVGFVDTNSKSNLVEAKCKPQWIRSPRLATVFATVTFMWSIYPSALFLFSWVCPWVERWPSETSLAIAELFWVAAVPAVAVSASLVSKEFIAQRRVVAWSYWILTMGLSLVVVVPFIGDPRQSLVSP